MGEERRAGRVLLILPPDQYDPWLDPRYNYSSKDMLANRVN
jgi:hypothetical protein